jgi:DHA2 family multidrug resistance protein-like MFS transporter
MMAWPLSVALTATLAGRIARVMSSELMCAAGGGLLALGLAAIAVWPPNFSTLMLIPFMAICGVGFGLFQVANNRNMFLSAPAERSGAAGGLQGAARLTGQTAGAVLVAQLFLLTPALAAPRIALGIGAVLTVAAGLVSTLRKSVR